MDNILRCSIIFAVLHIVCITFGFAYVHPILSSNYNKVNNILNSIFSDVLDDTDLSQEKLRDTPANFGYYDFVDYESADDQDQDQNNDALYFNENTQIVDNAYSDNGYEADESLMSADKRSRHPSRQRQNKRTNAFEDLCPVRIERYPLPEKWTLLGYKLRLPYKELKCNHTINHDDYKKETNRVCYSLGRTFEHGHGTHCFQRIMPKDIEIESIVDKKSMTYTETHFGVGCTCGWASKELGPIHDYHYDKILNLCSALKGPE